MLETELAAEVARTVVADAAQVKAMRVVEANVVVGAMRQIDEALFVQRLSEALHGTVADGARINLKRPAVTMRCAACGEVYPVTLGDKASYVCPKCGGEKRELATGMELGVEDMQVMLPPEHEGPSWADRLAKAVDDALGPVEKPAGGDR